MLERLGVTPVDAASALLEAGIGILQLRHKGFFSRDVFERARQIARLCAGAKAIFVVNDRADMAVLAGASGVHLGQEDLLPQDARKVLPAGFMCGLSTHNEAQLREAAAEPIDYVALGPIFGTTSKNNPDAVVGLAELRRLRELTEMPLVAIGGITRANASQVFEAGADSVAVIGDAFPPEGGAAAIRARAEEWMRLICVRSGKRCL